MTKGNNYNKKWKTQPERIEAFAAICKHIESGLSRESLEIADWDTVLAYCKEFPDDFPTDRLNQAFRAQMKLWESKGMDGTFGKIQGFNAASWQFNMKNRFKETWKDKHELDTRFVDKDGDDIINKDMELLKRFGITNGESND